ncbi:MAG: hypothetical protein AAF633_12995 [Chloroflexota bacterium]
MSEQTQTLIQSVESAEALKRLASGIQQMVVGQSITNVSMLGNRVRAVFLATNLLDDSQLREFFRRIENEYALRIGLYELAIETDLNFSHEMLVDPFEFVDVEWLVLITAAFAQKAGYPLDALDPSSPPTLNTPAGLMLQKVAQFMRRQIELSATEKGRLVKKLEFNPELQTDHAQMPIGDSPEVTAAPPHYRTPVPETYLEHNPGLDLSEGEVADQSAVALPMRGDALTITEDDLEQIPQVTHMPPIKITADQIPPKQATARRTTPANQPPPGPSTIDQLTGAISNLFNSESLGTTRLRILAQESPDGPGVYGLQVRVTCKGIRSHVAGTTDREGRFVCELPVRLNSGLTYDVDLTWPHEMGGDIERKSVTLSNDRPVYELPFYKRLN